MSDLGLPICASAIRTSAEDFDGQLSDLAQVRSTYWGWTRAVEARATYCSPTAGEQGWCSAAGSITWQATGRSQVMQAAMFDMGLVQCGARLRRSPYYEAEQRHGPLGLHGVQPYAFPDPVR